jgi:3-oxoacyl-[acyl-carrier protein] reductase
MDLGFAGRAVIVTGGSRGIGRATADLLAAEGARVAVTFCRHAERAEAVAAGIRERGGDACAAFLDLGDLTSIADVTRMVLDRWGRIDVIVNNAVHWVHASEYRSSLFEDVPADDWRPLIRSNVEGVYGLIQAVVPMMRAQRWGRIISVSSIAATDGMAGYAWYATAKAALHGMTRTLARELGPSGILVNVVMPGGTLTESLMEQIPAPVLERQGRSLPIRRLPNPNEVASVIAFLASPSNAVITGEIVRASGGR